jgi:hypothetical protein
MKVDDMAFLVRPCFYLPTIFLKEEIFQSIFLSLR